MPLSSRSQISVTPGNSFLLPSGKQTQEGISLSAAVHFLAIAPTGYLRRLRKLVQEVRSDALSLRPKLKSVMQRVRCLATAGQRPFPSRSYPFAFRARAAAYRGGLRQAFTNESL